MKLLIIHNCYHLTGGPERDLFNVDKLLKKFSQQFLDFTVEGIKNDHSNFENFIARNIEISNNFPKNKKAFLFYNDFLIRLFCPFQFKKAVNNRLLNILLY